MSNPLDVQVGGDHYKKQKIQPIEYIMANKLGFNEGNIVKYISRHGGKGRAEDVKKVIHYAQFILKFEYGEEEMIKDQVQLDTKIMNTEMKNLSDARLLNIEKLITDEIKNRAALKAAKDTFITESGHQFQE